MDKVDFKRERKDLYAPSATEFTVVEVPPFEFLMVNGRGNPNTVPAYGEALEALYALSYAAKFASKKQLGRDYVVGPLEGLWHSERREAFPDRAKDEWSWTMMIRQPEWITTDLWDGVWGAILEKNLAAVPLVRRERFEEGKSVQILHVGSYDDEGPTIERLHSQFLPANALVENGIHHEIYLGDPRRVAPEKLKTILRQPVRPARPARGPASPH